MKRLVEIEYHDYMDLKPNVDVRVFYGADEEALEKNVNEFVAHMKSHWNSGTTRLVGIMEELDAAMFVGEQIVKERANWQADSQEFIDRLCDTFKECYGTDVLDLLH